MRIGLQWSADGGGEPALWTADASHAFDAVAMRGSYSGTLASYNFAADDMTGIELSSYVYSKLVKGHFTRLPFAAK